MKYGISNAIFSCMYRVIIITMQMEEVKMAKKKKLTEYEVVAKAMNDAGCEGITDDMIEKSENECGTILYIAVIGDGMVIYTPQYKGSEVQFISFKQARKI